MKGFYLQDKHGRFCAFVASEIKMTGVVYAVSTCSNSDKFNKEVARSLAVGRLFTRAIVKNVSIGGSVKERILNSIVADADMPTRTREAAKLWLKNPPKPKIKKSKAA